MPRKEEGFSFLTSCRWIVMVSVATIVTCLFLPSCIRRPEGVAGESKMAEVIADMEVATAIADRTPQLSDDSTRKVMRQMILAQHGMSEKDYSATMDYYGHNIDDYAKAVEKAATIVKRRQRSLAAGGMTEDREGNNSIWPYQTLVQISPLSGSRTLEFIIPAGNIETGALLEWNMRVSDTHYMKIILGVDYEDGSLGYAYTECSQSEKPSIIFQTDSTKVVADVFGRLEVDRNLTAPLWIDSIALVNRPFVREEYLSRFPRQKTFTFQK